MDQYFLGYLDFPEGLSGLVFLVDQLGLEVLHYPDCPGFLEVQLGLVDQLHLEDLSVLVGLCLLEVLEDL